MKMRRPTSRWALVKMALLVPALLICAGTFFQDGRALLGAQQTDTRGLLYLLAAAFFVAEALTFIPAHLWTELRVRTYLRFTRAIKYIDYPDERGRVYCMHKTVRIADGNRWAVWPVFDDGKLVTVRKAPPGLNAPTSEASPAELEEYRRRRGL